LVSSSECFPKRAHRTTSLISTRIFTVKLPCFRLVEAWAELHQDELLTDWNLLHSGRAATPIEPLK
jgi:hypothetical protein